MPSSRVLAVLCILLASGCASPRPAEPTQTPAANACTPYPRPEIEDAQIVSGENAFDFMLGLVCDFSREPPRERPRVPGTANHTAAATYLYDGLRQHSDFAVRYQNFTGSEYETIMNQHTSSSYYFYFQDCRGDPLLRVRGLQFSNIVATSGTPGGAIVLLMAHWDSKRRAMDQPVEFISANDGPSGVGVLLELARLLSGAALPYELRILLTDGEDGFEDCHPLAGSTVYAQRLSAAERARVKSIILLDMVGDPEATFYKGCGQDEQLMDRIWARAQQLGVSQFKQQGRCNGTLDDHTPFEERGMKAVDIIDTGRLTFTPYWHTTADTPDKLDANTLGGVGRVIEAILREAV